MPVIKALAIRNLRNILSADLQPSSTLNIIHGENGSGKTSLLEALYLLGLARSFRSTATRPLVSAGQQEAVILGKLLEGQTLGVRKTSQGKQEVKVGGKAANSAAELAHELPVLLLNSDTFAILDGAPKARRSFLDWGVFHVEPLFFGNWRHTLRSLQHRNALLKRQASPEEISPWTLELARYGEIIHQERAHYVGKLLPLLENSLQQLLPDVNAGLQMSYEKGWDSALTLSAALEQSDDKDRRYGHTTPGPHRADLKITLDGVSAIDRLSRGQQKLVICAMKLAQSQLLRQEQNRQCLFLIDDLPAELDGQNRARVCRLLEQQKQQVFMTCIEPEQLDFCWQDRAQVRLFHVKHGTISTSNQVPDQP